MFTGMRESQSLQNPSTLYEQRECRTQCAIKLKARAGGRRQDTGHGMSRRSLRAKPPTRYELGWKLKSHKKDNSMQHGSVLETACKWTHRRTTTGVEESLESGVARLLLGLRWSRGKVCSVYHPRAWRNIGDNSRAAPHHNFLETRTRVGRAMGGILSYCHSSAAERAAGNTASSLRSRIP